MAKRDYYELLEVSQDASKEDIKKAYRRLARKFHPDVNPGDQEAEQKFKEVKEAYDVLSDEQKRARYDQFGHAGTEEGMGGFGNAGGDFGGFGDVFSDIFDMFGGGFGGGGAARRGPAKGTDLRLDLEISFKDAAFGVEKDVSIPRMEECDACDGSGAAPGTHPTTCDACGGAGQTRVTQQTAFGQFQSVRTCPKCHGEGSIIKNPCPKCHGGGRVKHTRKVHINIPAGVDDGSRLRLTGEGEPGERGGPRGDLYIFIHVKRHELFKRDGLDILCEIPISFAQAALGDEIEVPTLEGKVKFTIPESTQTGTSFRLKGKGIPRLKGYGRGDQHVKVQVVVPRRLSEKQKSLLRDFSKTMNNHNLDPKEKGFFEKVKDAFKESMG